MNRSLIEADSDATVFQHFCPEKLDTLPPSSQRMQWTDLVDQTLCEIQDRGNSIDEIEKVLQTIQMVPSAIELLKSLRANNTRVLILSDANTFFIDVILRNHGLHDLIADIITNPAYTDDKGRLRVNRRILATDPQHNCPNTCGVNICKGQELDRYTTTHGPFRRVMYVGDGMNDFCPGLRLKHNDHYFVRNGKALAKAMLTKPDFANRVSAQVTYWKDHSVIVDSVSKQAAVPSSL
ncbi:phosphatase phospho-type [Phascolomyces articulosus]|uniref:Phosphatase phospho-type n=1 Tax=Phascolomyces articulosus TaxID=60185 RepID=A0AAD5PHN0_9FUNG|nr:phosphatase phospho-type [Phascolomyces articulosus]